jgi:DNA-binding MarR family transcriptional regulator
MVEPNFSIAEWAAADCMHMLAYQPVAVYADNRRQGAAEIKERGMAAREVQAGRAGDGSSCNCTALRKASRRISLLYDMALAPSGLKTTQRAILAQIGRSEPTTVGALAEALVMDPGALAHTLKPLERDRLVAIKIDPDDRRNRLITLSARGRARLAETDALWAKAQRGFEIAFGRAESEALQEALRFLVSDNFVSTFEGSLGSPVR